jgi:flagellum-specific ATP synthase
MSHLASPTEREVATEVRRLLAVYEASRDLVELGAHQPGVNPLLDRAVELKPALDQILMQTPAMCVRRSEACAQLAAAIATTGASA